MVGYVYRITNIQTQKTYVGITENFERRKRDHIKALNNNTHHSSKLQEAWNYWGASNFEWTVREVQISQYDDLYAIEVEEIKKYNSFNDGYNCNSGGRISDWKQKVKNEDVVKFLCVQWKYGDGYGKTCEEIFGWSRGTASSIKRRLRFVDAIILFENLTEEEKNKIATDTFEEYKINEVALKRQLTQGGCAKAYQLTQNDFNFAFAAQELGFGYTPVANYLGVKPTTVKDWFNHRSREKEYNLYLLLSQGDKENLFKEVKEANLTTYDCMKGLKYNQDDILNYLCYKKIFNGKDSLVQNLFGWAEGTCYSIRRPGTYKVIKAKFDALPAEEIQCRANLINLAVDKSRN